MEEWNITWDKKLIIYSCTTSLSETAGHVSNFNFAHILKAAEHSFVGNQQY